MGKARPQGLSKRAQLFVVTLVAILIVIALVVVELPAVNNKPSKPSNNDDNNLPPTKGDWIINKTVTLDKKDLVIDGNITIMGTGHLILLNSTLKINAKGPDAIVIMSGGELHVNHTLIEFGSTPSAYRLRVRTGSVLDMKDSQIPFEILLNASGTDLENNIMTGQYAGLWVGSSDNRIVNNTITGSGSPVLDAGILLQNVSHNFISKNVVSGFSKNLYLVGSSNNTIYDNLLSSQSQSGAGIELSQSNDNIVTYNEFRNCQVGINLVGSVSNMFHHNNLIKNKKQAQDDRTNRFDDGTDGNYWSDYIGFDLNKDGKGDLPYIITLNDRDSHPFMAPVKRP